jgi:hypothetical protein
MLDAGCSMLDDERSAIEHLASSIQYLPQAQGAFAATGTY